MVLLYDEQHDRAREACAAAVSPARAGHNACLAACSACVSAVGFRLWQGIEAVIEILAQMTIAILAATKTESGGSERRQAGPGW